jgi:hypothetical protein
VHARVWVAEAEHERVVSAGDRRLAELARLQRIDVRVLGDLRDELLLRRPEIGTEDAHVLRLLGPKVPE